MSSSNRTITVLTLQGETGLPFQTGANLRDLLLAGGFEIRSACGGDGSCGQCQVRVAESGAIPFTDTERLRLSPAQLNDRLRLACQIFPTADLHVSLEQPVTQMAWRPLRDDEYSSLALPVTPQDSVVPYAVAIDLGTTHIRLALWDMVKGVRLAGRTGLNPQGSYGADVLTRLMEASRSSEVARRISGLVQKAIAEALADIAAQASLDLHDVDKVAIVGNTAMLSLLAGRNFTLLLQPEYWTRQIDCQPGDAAFLRESWGLADTAAIRFIAPLGGFIGSDLLAGVIATRLVEQPAGSLLIDFGTNSEMALWDGHTLHATSSAGGPAFEGSGISCGMQGEAGAIYRVEQNTGEGISISVLGEAEPLGLCGSGLVDAVALLRRNGRLDRVGRFTDGSKGFVLHEGKRRIELLHGDIDVLQRAKAAIGGGVVWLCRQAGMALDDLRQVYACGAFGHLLDVGNAQQIGLLPPTPLAAVRLESNTALAGCETLLLSTGGGENLDAVLAVSKMYNLAEDAGFESLYVENLFLQPMQAVKGEGAGFTLPPSPT
jgi:uncharacterized 2Fe-2S/4Fe-4S cluster protein (DUF4445 family)